jgi:hypothetical protein
MARPMRLALCAAALLAACAPAPMVAPGTPGVCTSGTCFAEIDVQNCATGDLRAKPDTLIVKAPNTIQWTINTAGFKFPANNGIVVQGPGFGNPQVTGNGKKFLLFDDHSAIGTFKYTVNLVKESDGAACAPKDPFINNQ